MQSNTTEELAIISKNLWVRLIPIINIGMETCENTDELVQIMHNASQTQELVALGITNCKVEFWNDVNKNLLNSIECPFCKTALDVRCPRAICSNCHKTINYSSNTSHAFCESCSAKEKKDCCHPAGTKQDPIHKDLKSKTI